MKAGEQLAAMEMMAVDPRSRVLAPRFVAGAISMPLLAAIFSAVGILGGYVVGVLMIGIDPGAFWSQMQSGVDVWDDVGNGIIKSVVFGVACTFIALYQGYEAEATPEGVSQATTRTVVISSLAVLGRLRPDRTDVQHTALALRCRSSSMGRGNRDTGWRVRAAGPDRGRVLALKAPTWPASARARHTQLPPASTISVG
jgi:hypothetical protein